MKKLIFLLSILISPNLYTATLTPNTIPYICQGGTNPQLCNSNITTDSNGNVQQPLILIGVWSDRTGSYSSCGTSNTGSYPSDTVIIDSRTDWAGKQITFIGSGETEASASWASGLPFSSAGTGVYTFTLPTNSYTVIQTSGPIFGNFNGTGSVGLGTNSLGNLTLYSIRNCGPGYSGEGAAAGTAAGRISGTNLRAS